MAEPRTDDADELRRGALRARWLLAGMAIIGVGATFLSMLLLYRAAVSEQKVRLQELVGSQAELIDAVARSHPVQRQNASDEGDWVATLKQVADSTARWKRQAPDLSLLILGRSRDALVIHVENGSLLPHSAPLPKDFPEPLAEQVVSAPRGTAEYEASDGRTWLVAHEHLRAFDAAVVARLSLDVLRRPLWHALGVSGLGALILLGLALVLLRKTSVSLVDDLAKSLARRVAAEAELQAHP